MKRGREDLRHVFANGSAYDAEVERVDVQCVGGDGSTIVDAAKIEVEVCAVGPDCEMGPGLARSTLDGKAARISIKDQVEPAPNIAPVRQPSSDADPDRRNVKRMTDDAAAVVDGAKV